MAELFDEADLKWHREMLKEAVRIFMMMSGEPNYQEIGTYRNEIDDFLESYR